MGTTAGKLAYLEATKADIRAALVEKGLDVPESTPFRQYGDLIRSIETTAERNLLNNMTWDEISAISSAGLAESYFKIGDAKQIDLSGKTIGALKLGTFKPWVYILGFNHNKEIEGNNMIHFGCFRWDQFYGITNGLALQDKYYGNNTSDQLAFHFYTILNPKGGWESSIMRREVLGADATSPSEAPTNSFLKALPDDLKAVLKKCKKWEDNAGSAGTTEASYVSETQDWIWLLSEYEVHGKITYANIAEQAKQEQYQYYASGNTKLKTGQESWEKVRWWTRSVRAKSYDWCELNEDGTPGATSPAASLGLAPGFCV